MILLPELIKLVRKMAVDTHDDNFLFVELSKLKYLESQSTQYFYQINELYENNLEALNTLSTISDMANSRGSLSSESSTLSEPLNMVATLMGLSKPAINPYSEMEKAFTL